eukprot:TRINITY_DN34436_c0_g1_i1.p1 TRINITY_DN34436_c0_g1~~TRINITY_DN34436_c0_g1_i1.p1  ORF type:complete len:102 (+),score=5.38 TRINITY_DN34436_c0_g1_i1:414-719(+)
MSTFHPLHPTLTPANSCPGTHPPPPCSSKLEPLPGLMNLLQDLKANDVRVSCVTNAPRLNAEAMLRALKLDTGVFEHVVCEYLARPAFARIGLSSSPLSLT